MTEENEQLTFSEVSPNQPVDAPYKGDAYEGDLHPSYHEPHVPLTEEEKLHGQRGVRAAKEVLKHIQDNSDEL